MHVTKCVQRLIWLRKAEEFLLCANFSKSCVCAMDIDNVACGHSKPDGKDEV